MYAGLKKAKENKIKTGNNAVARLGNKELKRVSPVKAAIKSNCKLLNLNGNNVSTDKARLALTTNEKLIAKKNGVKAAQLAKQSYKPTGQDPNPLLKGGVRYWRKGYTPAGFIKGGDYYNSIDGGAYKGTSGGNEVHVTLDTMKPSNMDQALRDEIQATQKWKNRNIAMYGNRIDLTNWHTQRFVVEKYHISIKDPMSGANIGGWFSIAGAAALPNYTNKSHVLTANDTTVATTLRTKMINKIL